MSLKVALVHDYLREFGGAERVLMALAEVFPEAPIYTAVYDERELRRKGKSAENRKQRTDQHPPSASCSQRLSPVLSSLFSKVIAPPVSRFPFISRFYKYFSFFYPLVFEGFDLREFNLVISSSSNFAKGVLTRPGQMHICYCHTVPRFLYGYSTEGGFRQHWFWGRILPALDNYLRVWDWCAAQRVDFFVANSQEVARRIKKFYGREAVVIYPPVEVVKTEDREQETVFEGRKQVTEITDQNPPSALRPQKLSSVFCPLSSYFLTVSRLARYKNVGLIIRACNQLGLDLVVAGEGPERKNLEKLAGPTVKIVGRVGEEQLAKLYRDCQAVICAAQDEDFGLVPVEAMSFGKPVLALRGGGFKETVLVGETGEFFDQPTVASLQEALADFDPQRYQFQVCQTQAQKFSKQRFQQKFQAFVKAKLLQRLF